MSSSDADRIRLAAEYLPEIRLESTRNRISQVGNIGIADGKNGSYVMTADIDGEQVRRNVTEQQRDKFLLLENEKREKLFAKTFDCKGVKTVPGAEASVSDQIMDAVVGNNKGKDDVSKNIENTSNSSTVAESQSTAVSKEVVSEKASQLAAANFESVNLSSKSESESVKTGISR